MVKNSKLYYKKYYNPKLKVKVADDLKSLKNKELICGNDTEIRAQLLRKKLLLIKELTDRTFMLPTDVSKFLAKELPNKVKVTHKNTRIYSRRVMHKTVQLFPNEFRIGKNEKRILYIEFI